MAWVTCQWKGRSTRHLLGCKGDGSGARVATDFIGATNQNFSIKRSAFQRQLKAAWFAIRIAPLEMS